jgi:hypothetical protein
MAAEVVERVLDLPSAVARRPADGALGRGELRGQLGCAVVGPVEQEPEHRLVRGAHVRSLDRVGQLMPAVYRPQHGRHLPPPPNSPRHMSVPVRMGSPASMSMGSR